jgi:hypothetical protein
VTIHTPIHNYMLVDRSPWLLLAGLDWARTARTAETTTDYDELDRPYQDMNNDPCGSISLSFASGSHGGRSWLFIAAVDATTMTLSLLRAHRACCRGPARGLKDQHLVLASCQSHCSAGRPCSLQPVNKHSLSPTSGLKSALTTCAS